MSLQSLLKVQHVAEAILLLLADSYALPVLLPASLCWLKLTWLTVLRCGGEHVYQPVPIQHTAGMRVEY